MNDTTRKSEAGDNGKIRGANKENERKLRLYLIRMQIQDIKNQQNEKAEIEGDKAR